MTTETQPLLSVRDLKTLDALWPDARVRLAGETWEPGWADWSARRDAARKLLGQPPAPAQSPRNTTR